MKQLENLKSEFSGSLETKIVEVTTFQTTLANMNLEVTAQMEVSERVANLSTDTEAIMRDSEATMALRDTDSST